MATLEELVVDARVLGLRPGEPVTVISTRWRGSLSLNVTYRNDAGHTGERLLSRADEPRLTIVSSGPGWAFDAPGDLARLVSEAKRIQLAWLFDPMMAVSSSDIEPLPHQITAVYDEMLTRRPLRFLLADDPGAGKTIMTGLLIKELWLRGDLERCLIVCPGSLIEQWHDELRQKFDLPFTMFGGEASANGLAGNWFAEHDLVLCRLDQLSRNETLQDLLKQTSWDLTVCDEAHKMSASYYGNEKTVTKRYALGKLLGEISRHFLLLSATPHNGKNADFYLFLALLDPDRFEGKPAMLDGKVDTGDLMRRLVKEQLVTMENKPLFPERIAETLAYALSPAEQELYDQVTDYVRQEFGRADALGSDGRKGTVGFALTVLQRRLASSPEAILQSLRRRRERLETRLAQLPVSGVLAPDFPVLNDDELDDLDDGLGDEVENQEEELVDRATAARGRVELAAEIETLKRLERLALEVRQRGVDRKWEELSTILHDRIREREPDERRRKLVIFTEQRDTLHYLQERIGQLLGRPDALVTITGGMDRAARRAAQEQFANDPRVEILLATDAAGEGINLQRAHLMVNYDLPWNPNRLEQRFGRIHRIGQTEVCYLWNLVASETREGEVFQTLFAKLQEERKALEGRVFDVLGRVVFENERSLRDLMIEAIRNGNDPGVRDRLNREVEQALDHERLKRLLDEQALYQSALTSGNVREIAEKMERAAASRLQPHFVSTFFQEAFARLGGQLYEREPRRFEITRAPRDLITWATGRRIGAVAPRYQRITFERAARNLPDKPAAAFISPGHPLLEATIGLTLEQHEDLLQRGAVLLDPRDAGDEPRVLFYLDHAVQDGSRDARGQPRTISRELLFVEIDRQGNARDAGPAPYLDYEPLTPDDLALIEPLLHEPWLAANLTETVENYAIDALAEPHFTRIQQRRKAEIDRTRRAVVTRLTAEMMRLDQAAATAKQKEEAGKQPRANSARLEHDRDALQARLERRQRELDAEEDIANQMPRITGAVLVIPRGLLARLRGEPEPEAARQARETRRIELAAMESVMMVERALGFEPRDVSAQNRGYDIESRPKDTIGGLRFLEVKGRIAGSETVTVTRNEILTALNEPDQWFLVVVEIEPGANHGSPRYYQRCFTHEPQFAETAAILNLRKLADFEVTFSGKM